FYRQPSIKYLSQAADRSLFPFIFTKGKPSYISKENFSGTLVNMLREAGRGIHDWGKISYSVEYNALHFDRHTDRQLKAFLQDADDDMEVFIIKLEAWYQEMMDRTNGWYKRKMQLVIFGIGLIVVTILNVDTLEVVRLLSEDQEKREQFVRLATAAADEDTQIGEMIDQLDEQYIRKEIFETLQEVWSEVDHVNLYLGSGWDFPLVPRSYTLNSAQQVGSDRLRDSLEMTKDSLNALQLMLKESDAIDYVNLNTLLSNIHGQESLYNRLIRQINAQYHQSFIQIDTFVPVGETYRLEGLVLPSRWDNAKYIMRSSSPLKSKFWGFIITALALSLGAPFWFDLLKKLVAIRKAGVNPEEKEPKKTDLMDEWIMKRREKSQLGKTIKNAAPVEIALAHHQSSWESIPGVIAVNSVLNRRGKRTGQFKIEVIHHSGTDVTTIPEEVHLKSLDAKIKIDKKLGEYAIYQEGEQPTENETHDDRRPYAIKRAMRGTVAGKLKNLDSKQVAILTCAHVLSENGSSIVYDGREEIKKLGRINKMIWSNFLDAGVVDLTDDHVIRRFPHIPPLYTVETRDMTKKTKVFIVRSDKTKVEARIVHNDYEYVFDDRKGELYKLKHLIAISNEKNEMVTQDGDSGALVITENGKSVGIVIGGYERKNGKGRSFVLPMKVILQALNLEVIQN
ncbi:MAG: hypothetical protein KDC80_02115, partial [Saprospiraceae bacterium]|nr:hypothetical protein [Saprospiraceae bacterium]